MFPLLLLPQQKKLKTIFDLFVKYQTVSNLIIIGKSGCGKSMITDYFLKKELEKRNTYTIFKINNFQISNIQEYQNLIKRTGKKLFIIDEITDLDTNIQKNINIMISTATNSKFIICCNNLTNINSILSNKCSVFNFPIPSDKELFDYYRLQEKSSKINDENLMKIIKYSESDFRKINNNIEYYNPENFFLYDKIWKLFNDKEIIDNKEIINVYKRGYTCKDIIGIIDILIKNINSPEIQLQISEICVKISLRNDDGIDTKTQLVYLLMKLNKIMINNVI